MRPEVTNNRLAPDARGLLPRYSQPQTRNKKIASFFVPARRKYGYLRATRTGCLKGRPNKSRIFLETKPFGQKRNDRLQPIEAPDAEDVPEARSRDSLNRPTHQHGPVPPPKTKEHKINKNTSEQSIQVMGSKQHPQNNARCTKPRSSNPTQRPFPWFLQVPQ